MHLELYAVIPLATLASGLLIIILFGHPQHEVEDNIDGHENVTLK